MLVRKYRQMQHTAGCILQALRDILQYFLNSPKTLRAHAVMLSILG
jgi:hypothetical protein